MRAWRTALALGLGLASLVVVLAGGTAAAGELVTCDVDVNPEAAGFWGDLAVTRDRNTVSFQPNPQQTGALETFGTFNLQIDGTEVPPDEGSLSTYTVPPEVDNFTIQHRSPDGVVTPIAFVNNCDIRYTGTDLPERGQVAQPEDGDAFPWLPVGLGGLAGVTGLAGAMIAVARRRRRLPPPLEPTTGPTYDKNPPPTFPGLEAWEKIKDKVTIGDDEEPCGVCLGSGKHLRCRGVGHLSGRPCVCDDGDCPACAGRGWVPPRR